MTPQELQRLARIEALLMALVKSDRYLLEKHLQIADGRNVQVGKTTGTMIGTEATQKLGFFGNTPIVQPVQMPAPTEARPSTNRRETASMSLSYASRN